MRAGDIVLHKPSGQRWVVAHVSDSGEMVAWCGWPGGMTNTTDVELVEPCDDATHMKTLRDLSRIGDFRSDHARRTLDAMETSNDNETDGQMLRRLGTNHIAWAEEFCRTAVRQGGFDPANSEHVDWLAGWFANAMMAEHDAIRGTDQ